MERKKIPAPTKWAEAICYSRAVRVGLYVAVSQTSSADVAGNIVGGANVYSQAVHALRNVEAALCAAGAQLSDVVRTRMYVSRIEDWTEVARAHAEVFRDIRPATSLVICGMVAAEILVEFEADAVITSDIPSS
jgi:enamine deaminase RidA (YjgF/YER057c/UK114 family)